MKTKTLTGLLILATLTLFVTPVSAAPWPDQWFIDNAETGVEEAYTLPEREWDGTVTSGWHNHGSGWHKHVDLSTKYSEKTRRGYKYIHLVDWDGRSYASGDIYTLQYTHTRTRFEPSYNYKTTWKNPQYRKIWNGNQWIDNPNTYSYWEDGRFLVVFPKP